MRPHKFVPSDIGEWFDEYTCVQCGLVVCYAAEDMMSDALASETNGECKGVVNAKNTKGPPDRQPDRWLSSEFNEEPQGEEPNT